MSTPTLYAVRDDGAELWDTGEPSPFPGEPGLGYIVGTDGRKYDARPILSLTARGSWTPIDREAKADVSEPEEKREYVRDADGQFADVPGSGLSDFITSAASSPDPVNLSAVNVTGSKRPSVFTDNIGMNREDMPQVPNSHKAIFVDQLQSEGVDVTKEKVDPMDLKPVQGEIDARLAARMLPFDPTLTEGNPISVSSDGYVLDGHHRWAGAVAERQNKPDLTITVLRFDLPIDDLLERARQFNEETDIVRRSFGDQIPADMGSKNDLDLLLSLSERQEIIAEFKGGLEYAESKKIRREVQRHGGWLWAGRPGGGGRGGVKPSHGDGPDIKALRPDIITMIDPVGMPVPLTKNTSLWHHMEQQPDGSWALSAERRAFHERIMAQFIEGVPPSDDPTEYMLGGGPGAGKTTLINSGRIDIPSTWSPSNPDGKREAILAAGDEIKPMLPEYEMGGVEGAGFVHEESSLLSKQLVHVALATGRDVVVDGTGNSTEASIASKIQQARDAGHQVRGFYVTIPIEEAQRRAKQREIDTGRGVQASTVTSTHVGVSKVFPLAHRMFDEIQLFDMMDAFGPEGPHLIAEGKRDEPLTIMDAQGYRAFLDKGKE